MNDVSLSKIENMIYVVRGQKVMLDSDLADLYDVETKQLNRQVRRNALRFPEDFMFQLISEEFREIQKIKTHLNNTADQERTHTFLQKME